MTTAAPSEHTADDDAANGPRFPDRCAPAILRVRIRTSARRAHFWSRVLPTVPFDLMFSVLVGLLFAACARHQFTSGAAPWGRELAAVLSFEAIILWPVALYYYLVYPDWSWMYFVDARRLPSGVSVLVLLSYAASLLGGYLAGWALLRARRLRLLGGALAFVALFMGGFVVVCRGRLFAAGTFAEYHAGHAPSAGEGKLAWALVVTAIGVAVGIGVVGLALWEQGKRPRAS